MILCGPANPRVRAAHETGMLLADDAAARDYAERLIREIKGGDGHETNLTMIVERSGIVIFTIPFQDV